MSLRKLPSEPQLILVSALARGDGQAAKGVTVTCDDRKATTDAAEVFAFIDLDGDPAARKLLVGQLDG